MDGQEDRGEQGQDHDVEHVEAQQRVLADLDAAEQDAVTGVATIGKYDPKLVPMVMAQNAIWSHGSR